MDKANFAVAKGLPIYKADLGFLQDANFAAFKALCKGFSQSGIDTFILDGVVCTVTIDGIQCTAGYMVYKGEVMQVDEVVDGTVIAGEPAATPIVTYPGTLNPVTLSDLSTANVYAVRKATIVDDGLAIGDNVIYSTIPRIEDLIRNMVNGTDVWHEVGEVSQPAFASGWANATPSNIYNKVAFKKMQNGEVLLRGRAYASAYSGSTYTVFTLPADYIPAKSYEQFLASPTGVGQLTLKVFGNSESAPNRGKVQVVSSDTGVLYATLDQFRYFID